MKNFQEFKLCFCPLQHPIPSYGKIHKPRLFHLSIKKVFSLLLSASSSKLICQCIYYFFQNEFVTVARTNFFLYKNTVFRLALRTFECVSNVFHFMSPIGRTIIVWVELKSYLIVRPWKQYLILQYHDESCLKIFMLVLGTLIYYTVKCKLEKFTNVETRMSY